MAVAIESFTLLLAEAFPWHWKKNGDVRGTGEQPKPLALVLWWRYTGHAHTTTSKLSSSPLPAAEQGSRLQERYLTRMPSQ